MQTRGGASWGQPEVRRGNSQIAFSVNTRHFQAMNIELVWRENIHLKTFPLKSKMEYLVSSF